MDRDRLDARAPGPRPARPTARQAEAGPAGAVLGLQRTAGNAAVTSWVTGVQRAELDDVFGPSPFGGGGGTSAPTTEPPGEQPAGGINELGPVARTGTLIADSIIASSYTPGAGNLF